MANYTCAVRTNYFKVRDPEAFRVFMQRVYGEEDHVSLWEQMDNSGVLRFGFGSYGGIGGLRNEPCDDDDEYDDDDDTYDAFIDGLQAHIAEDDACLIFEAGHEKLRYVTGSCTIVTAKETRHLDIADMGVRTVRDELLGPEWTTKTYY